MGYQQPASEVLADFLKPAKIYMRSFTLVLKPRLPPLVLSLVDTTGVFAGAVASQDWLTK